MSESPRCPVSNAVVAALGAAATPYCSSFLSISTQTYTDVVESYFTVSSTETAFVDSTVTVTADPTTATSFETTTAMTCTAAAVTSIVPRGAPALKTIIITATTTICPCTAKTSSEAPCSESAYHGPSGYSDSIFAYTAIDTSSSEMSTSTPCSDSVYHSISTSAASYGTSVPSYMSVLSSSTYDYAHNSSSTVYGTTAYSSGVTSYTPEPSSSPSSESSVTSGSFSFSPETSTSTGSSTSSSESPITSDTSTTLPTPTPTGSELLTTIGDRDLTSACNCLHIETPVLTVESTTYSTTTIDTTEWITPTITETPTITATSTITSTSTIECSPSSTPEPSVVTVTLPSPIQGDFATNCDSFATPDSGAYCSLFATEQGITLAELETWNLVLQGDGCATSFWYGYYYCVGVSSTPVTYISDN
ncbi:hypothetical protein BU16DRAFT_577346 [Lophium mytilinum]|uniref:LysM domain-containing protein n=1 Tax=Lophium mytilinum TaxID=390894 RepID=A0A6A6R8Q5_9PEZI|nr:hypothetical protein BU16DRAFT_577346 [Lophium mytilinum]